MIKLIEYEDILPYWEEHLWVDRKDPIEPTSCMKYLGGYQQNQNLPASYIAWFENGKIVGVNSGHACEDNSYRSRGLWVDPSMRGKGIGQQLLFGTVALARGYDFCWSFPRQSSWRTYEAVGFELTSSFEENINNTNAYCVMEMK